MRRARTVLFCLLIATMNVSAQDSTPLPRAPSAKEKEQALAALTVARSTLFPMRRRVEARQLLANIAPLLAAAGDTAGAQEVLMLLPANDRDAIQSQIVEAQIRSGDLAGALQTATTISPDDAHASALLLVVEAQAKSGEFGAAMRTAGLIPSGRVESAQALLEVAQQQKLAGKRDEATQLLRRAAMAAASLMNSSGGDPNCGLSVLAQIVKTQQSLNESTEAIKTLQLAEGRVTEADEGCKFQAARYLQDDNEGRPEVLTKEVAGFRESLVSSAGASGDDDPDEVDSSSAEENAPESALELQSIPLQQPSQNGQATFTREQAQAALESLRNVRPLYLRVQAAMNAARLLAADGKAGEAEEAILLGLEAADTIQDENLRGVLLASKAQVLAAAKDWERARAAVDEIPNGQQRTAALVDIAFNATEDGHEQLALSWATVEPSPLLEASVLLSVAAALLHQPQQTSFIRWFHS